MINIQKKNDKELLVSFKYNSKLVESIKKIDGRRWDQENRYWIIPNTESCKAQLLSEFKTEEIIWHSEVDLDNYRIKFEKIYNLDDIIFNLKKQLILKGYTNKTIKAYIGHVKRFLQYSNKTLN